MLKSSKILGLGIVCIAVSSPLFAAGGEKAPTTVQAMMQRKLQATHELFDAIISKDYKKAEKATTDLKDISKATLWYQPDSPEFVHYAKSFQNSADAMLEQVKLKNYEGMGMNYFRITLACMYCHNNVRFNDPKYKEKK